MNAAEQMVSDIINHRENHKSHFKNQVREMTGADFKRLCNNLLAAYEFLVKYEGVYATEDEDIIKLHPGPCLEYQYKEYNKGYIDNVLAPIQSPINILGDVVTDGGFDKHKFLSLIDEMSRETYMEFVLEMAALLYFADVQVGNVIISKEVADSLCKGECWQVNFDIPRQRIKQQLQEQFK